MGAECTVPELGENVESATVVEVFVAVGDVIRIEQPILSLETDKAEFEMPANAEGRVTELLVKPGDEVTVGQAVLRVETAPQGASREKPASTAKEPVPGETFSAPAKDVAASGDQESRDPEDSELHREAGSQPSKADAEKGEVAKHPGDVEPAPEVRRPSKAAPVREGPRESSRAVLDEAGAGAVAAAPSVRRLARELGVDLAQVHGSLPGGRISAEDVTAHVRSRGRAVFSASHATPAELPDFTRWGEITIEKMSKVRARTAEQMALAWSSIPHVTHHDKADVSELDRLRRQYAARVERAGGKLTMTAVLLKVLGAALGKFPKFNASVDMTERVIVYKKYVHVGVAVDTDRGLLVPVIRDVDQKNIVEIARALSDLSDRARGRNIKPEELQGASFTLTNLGGIGGTAFSPLINPPEVAVLGVASARLEPVAVDGSFEPRMLLPLSISYDHRVIDGADAARFLRWVCEALEEPFVMDLEGR
jgi:pyruvate dehydrogenase E2 component (dihydrolipoamide acetyltransferase)